MSSGESEDDGPGGADLGQITTQALEGVALVGLVAQVYVRVNDSHGGDAPAPSG